MNRIEKLISELCPEGVEYKNIETLIKYKTIITIAPPKKLIKKYYQPSGTFPIIDQGQNFIVGYTDDVDSVVSNGSYVIFGDHTESIKYVDFAFAQGADGLKILKTNTEIINTRFLYYLLCNYYKKTGKYTRHFNFLKKTIIPIPPLPVQEEIVKILDTFTELEAELEAELEKELEARKKQYEYYRNKLLTPVEVNGQWLLNGKPVEWKKLGEVAYYPTKRISAENVNKINYIGVENLLPNKQGKTDSSYVPMFGNLIEYRNNDILIGNIRPYLKKIWLSNCNGGTNGDVIVVRIKNEFKESISPNFLYFLLSSDNFFEYDMRFSKGAKMPRGDKIAVLNFPIPIPPLEEQERIVAILDKFDALVNDISQGLPAEIEARRKQYEYYRNKLLTFKGKK